MEFVKQSFFGCLHLMKSASVALYLEDLIWIIHQDDNGRYELLHAIQAVNCLDMDKDKLIPHSSFIGMNPAQLSVV